ncbi:MAG: transcription-repair coupling factor [Bdellovibrio sp.]|nr:transcription-repair coupling factor [Bdellovibrio sp.]
MKWQTTQTRLEDFLLRGFEKDRSLFNIVGSSSLAASSYLLSQSLSKEINNLPRLVVVSSLEQALAFEQHLSFFSNRFQCHILRPYDVSPFSGLTPSPVVRFSRTRFLYRAAHAQKSDIFIAPISALLQLSVPFFNFSKRSQLLKQGDELPTNLAEYFNSLGYQSTPLVEDIGQYSLRGGIVDVFSPAETHPVRLELFGDQVESMRTFSLVDQRSLAEVNVLNIVPAYEIDFTDENVESVIKNFRQSLKERPVPHSEVEEVVRSISLKNYFPGSEYLLSNTYAQLESPLDHFSSALNIFMLDPSEVSRASDEYYQELTTDSRAQNHHVFHPDLTKNFISYEKFVWPEESRFFQFSRLAFLEDALPNEERIEYNSLPLSEFSQLAQNLMPVSDAWIEAAQPRLKKWLETGYKIFVSAKNQTQIDRLKMLLQKMNFSFHVAASDDYLWDTWLENPSEITIIPRVIPETILFTEEKIIFLRTDDFFGRKQRANAQNAYEQFSTKAKSLAFGDLKPTDLVVHVKHGIGVYEGLKIMNIGGVETEYIQIAYKDKDKLYLPVYRVGQLQKFSGAGQTSVLDKLGGVGWEKTKIKVKAHLRDIAAELLQLYAKRNEITRDPLLFDELAYHQFEKGFPFDETDDQLKAINDIQKDFHNEKPMDRLVCGDVGFGKTEVSMRAAFQVVQNKKQVGVLAPTTVLTFQHLETFKRRFEGWNFQIRSLNRFVSPAEQKKTLAELKEGKVDILIGTHRLLSKDVVFKDLGLLIVDEEQKFGVTHKEKIKKFKVDIDTLTLSATPIPRTLNMSFTGMRDLSIINTAPVDRLPTRTFISKFDPELIRKGIQSEIARGGQVYFIHNRVQSIYGIADQLRQIVPDARMKVAHGQMNEEDLEHAMISFFNHEIDVLICTSIVESGMDVPRANTMFIDQAHMFGLSQLYQLRGRVGRSKARAFCYLLLPKDKRIEKDAQERLKIIQDNSALGSGIRIAQYDLELRGAGNILGDSQSGHVNSVGYELYMDLLNEALAEAKGEPMIDRELDPEINLRVPALIPDSYIADIRIRLSYYKALADISSQEDLDRIEDDLKDQFGDIPEPVINLMGLMLIRKQCKDLGVRDISAGLKNISLIFTERTRLKPETAIQLAMRENKKYSITPDQRLNIRLNNITWSSVYEELNYLLTLI